MNDEVVINFKKTVLFSHFSLNFAYSIAFLLLKMQYGSAVSLPKDMDGELKSIINGIHYSKELTPINDDLFVKIESDCVNLFNKNSNGQNQLPFALSNLFKKIFFLNSSLQKENANKTAQSISQRLVTIWNNKKQKEVSKNTPNFNKLSKEKYDTSVYQMPNLINAQMVDILNKYYSSLVFLLNKEKEDDTKIIPYSSKVIQSLENKQGQSNGGVDVSYLLAYYIYASYRSQLLNKEVLHSSAILDIVREK